MATGPTGGYGKSVQKAVDKVTGPEPEPAVTPPLSMVGSPVMAVLWIQSYVILGLAQVREERFKIAQGAAHIGFFFLQTRIISACFKLLNYKRIKLPPFFF